MAMAHSQKQPFPGIHAVLFLIFTVYSAKFAFFDTSVLSFKLYWHFRIVGHYSFSLCLCFEVRSNDGCIFIFH